MNENDFYFAPAFVVICQFFIYGTKLGRVQNGKMFDPSIVFFFFVCWLQQLACLNFKKKKN